MAKPITLKAPGGFTVEVPAAQADFLRSKGYRDSEPEKGGAEASAATAAPAAGEGKTTKTKGKGK